jgi:hypothetical protein
MGLGTWLVLKERKVPQGEDNTGYWTLARGTLTQRAIYDTLIHDRAARRTFDL